MASNSTPIQNITRSSPQRLVAGHWTTHGGARLQQINRDTLKFALKCSASTATANGTTFTKTPKTDPSKASKVAASTHSEWQRNLPPSNRGGCSHPHPTTPRNNPRRRQTPARPDSRRVRTIASSYDTYNAPLINSPKLNAGLSPGSILVRAAHSEESIHAPRSLKRWIFPSRSLQFAAKTALHAALCTTPAAL